jgi:uncharacterized membrane protein (UPF0182 family)
MPDRPFEPEIVLPHGGLPRRGSRVSWILLALLFLVFLGFHNAVPLYTDWLWFQEVGYTAVFTTTIVAKTTLFVLFGGLFFALFYGNIAIARRLAPEFADRFLMERMGPDWGQKIQRGLGWLLAGVALFMSLWAGRIAADVWANWLEFTHAQPFHLTDPVFHLDIGFYVFKLPFLNFLQGFLLSTLVLTSLAVVAIHVADRAIESWAGLPDIRPGVRAQLLTLLALIALDLAFGTRLGAYDLLQSDNGLFTGAGYVDLHSRLFAMNAQCAILVLTALACLLSVRSRHFKAPLFGAAAWLFALVVLGGIVPGAIQKFSVDPNQLGKEQPYIERNIRYTRSAYGLQGVRQVEDFPADQSLTATQLEANRATLDNVRLWDYQYLGKVYEQLQTIKQYYKYGRLTTQGATDYNIDIDRYTFDGKLRQVMLAPREMDPSALPGTAQTWQNQRLSYTHGYGLTMSPVNRTSSGDPTYFIDGFPPASHAEAKGLQVTRPEIYYGQLNSAAIYVDTAQQEFDYPSTGGANGGQDHYSTYTGKGGIRIGDSELRKLAFATRLDDWNLLLANNLKPQTRVLFRRDIRERLMTVAPWVQQDSDPYLVVNPDDGRLLWIVDCYTLSDRYPYSTPHTLAVNTEFSEAPNYIRNSVKATIDAYDGSVNLYLADPTDPIARTYGSIFPGTLKPISSLPAGLQAHLRYPEDLFRIQRAIYATYHVDDPRIFYLKEDVWSVPSDPTDDPNAPARQMEPYYIIMRLPSLDANAGAASSGQISGTRAQNEEFLLMSPLSPINKESQNILGWMCARCDPGHYGELVLYRFPQQASVLGPSQIVQRINSDKVISPQLSLLRSGGSTATLGNLLVIPVEKSLLYIAPLYVEATSSGTKLPKLQKVVVAFGDNEAMDDTLDKALAQLFPGYGGSAAPPAAPPSEGAPAPPTTAGTGHVPPVIRALIDEASGEYDVAQQKLKAGDFAGYGAATRQLQQTLNRLRASAGR